LRTLFRNEFFIFVHPQGKVLYASSATAGGDYPLLFRNLGHTPRTSRTT
jgi:hypothetical protein